MPGTPHLTDKAWALAHHPGTFTPWHHGGDGKVTCIIPKLGVKMWSAYIPAQSLSPVEVDDVVIELCQEKIIIPKSEDGTVLTVMLKYSNHLALFIKSTHPQSVKRHSGNNLMGKLQDNVIEISDDEEVSRPLKQIKAHNPTKSINDPSIPLKRTPTKKK
ncbi:hypothetical protein VKT23_017118 [Stygiomarasmius scandens]|uniref:Uncharacterized protein n=1 Tax=Marasmiellus scandens TaxID=2682957 RepID=A0ABR1IUU9_9AGAR